MKIVIQSLYAELGGPPYPCIAMLHAYNFMQVSSNYSWRACVQHSDVVFFTS